LDYGRYVGFTELNNYQTSVSNGTYPVVKISPILSQANLTIVTYGGMCHEVLSCIDELFYEHDFKSEIIVLSQINPINVEVILDSVETSRTLVVIEEGNPTGGISSEVIAMVAQQVNHHVRYLKIGALPVPIPAVKSLENQVLPRKERIIDTISQKLS